MSGPSVTMFFEGRPVTAREGASVAVALWEQGHRVLSHSPKYGRPRGASCARGHCMDCLMRIDGVPNVRACLTPARDGMRVERQDSGAVYGDPMRQMLDRTGHLMPVGFYYKWFTRPGGLSRLFLSMIRPLTGVGRLPEAATWGSPVPDTPARDLGHVDTVVVGAGAAGLGEALAADGPVLVVDENELAGGQRRAALEMVAEAGFADELPRLAALRSRLADLAERVDAEGRIELRTGTTVVGAWQPDMLLLHDADGLAVVRARTLVWAAGALDALPIFDDNDRPGLLGPRALYRLVARDGLDVAGRSVLVTGTGMDAALAAALLHIRGARVNLALGTPADPDLLACAARHGWSLHTGLSPAESRIRDGALSALVLTGDGGARTELPCELAVLCGRGKPAYDLAYQLGVDLVLDPDRGGYVPRNAMDGRSVTTAPSGAVVVTAGEAAGALPDDLIPEVTA